jgi:AraC-like DNA-binding protein
MDYPVSLDPAENADPVVVMAGHFQFGPNEVVVNRDVASRALIWGCAGEGAVEAAGRTVALRPGAWIFLPWLHDITYRADPHDPFMVGGVHVIPWHDRAVPVETHAAHGRRDRLAGVRYRRDVDWADLRELVEGTAGSRDRLLSLASLAVDHLQNGHPSDVSLRALARLLLHELRAARVAEQTAQAVPPTLTRMQEYIAVHLAEQLTVGRVAAAVSISESSAERLFRGHTGRSVGAWITERRMDVARTLLRTTRRSVAEIGLEVGFRDASYFSRAFRRLNGVPPKTYAERSRLL